MQGVFDAFRRALADCLQPRVLALSLLPLFAIVAGAWLLGHFYWEGAVAWTSAWLTGAGLLQDFWAWLRGMGMGRADAMLAPLLVVLAVLPLVILAALLVVALAMTPALLGLVAGRRFPQLERRRGASFVQSLLWSVGSTLAALVALVLSVPLWLVPPLILVLPPLIWGWLTYRVMAFDALAAHASTEERRAIFRRHGGRLLAMGIICGYLGAAPGVVWLSGALFVALLLPLTLVAVWIYTMVFAFSALWFLHYCLAALQELRAYGVQSLNGRP
ncbi:EI24 domain-containing protein [Xylophilus sp. GW821-FHT01B05]